MKLTTMIWAALSGKLGAALLAEEATFAGVPYEQVRFWPARFAFGRDAQEPKPWTVNRAICPELYQAKIGDVVPVYVDDHAQYLYQVHGFSWASGDDHIVSPREFHIRYAGRSVLAAEGREDE